MIAVVLLSTLPATTPTLMFQLNMGFHDEAFSFCGVTFMRGLGLILHDAIFNDET